MSRVYEWATGGSFGSWHAEPCAECAGLKQRSQVRPTSANLPSVRLWWFADRNDSLCCACRKDWDEQMLRDMEQLAEQEERAKLLDDQEDEA